MKKDNFFAEILKFNKQILLGLNNFLFPICLIIYFKVLDVVFNTSHYVLITCLFILSTINYFYVCFDGDKK